MTRRLMSRALSFAHLSGLAGRAATTDDNSDDDTQTQNRDDGDANDDGDSSNDSTDNKGKKGNKAHRADNSNDDGNDGKPNKDDDENEDADSDPDAEDDEDEMKGKSAQARARRRERARCAAIFGSRAAARNPEMAAHLAFNTSMGRHEAISLLKTTGAAAPANPARASRNPQLGAGGNTAPSSTAQVQAGWDRAFGKVSSGNRR